MNDRLDEFLHRDFEQPADEHLRQAILDKTTGVLSRGRMLRRIRIAAALAACFVVGVAVGGLGFATHSVERVPIQVASPADTSSTKTQPAVTEEWKAFDAQENRAEFYLAAGRRYFRESGDYAAALRCYRQALDLASEEALVVTPEDDWLLATLKQARKKEHSDASLN